MDARRTGAAKDQKDHVAPTHAASCVRGTLIRDGHGTDCIMALPAFERGCDKYRGETWKLFDYDGVLLKDRETFEIRIDPLGQGGAISVNIGNGPRGR